MTLIPIIEKTQICFVHCGKEVCKCNPSKTINEMKQIEFKTEKGVFVAHNLPCDDAELLGRMDDFNWSYSSKSIGWGKFPMRGKFKFICKLYEATEEDAKWVVDELWNGYKNYNSDGRVGNYARLVVKTSLESLHSLLTSKGMDINNGNWYLFKKI